METEKWQIGDQFIDGREEGTGREDDKEGRMDVEKNECLLLIRHLTQGGSGVGITGIRVVAVGIGEFRD